MTPLHDAIFAEVTRARQPLMNDLADVVQSRAANRDDVIAAVWELIDDGRLTYSADARVRLATEEPR